MKEWIKMCAYLLLLYLILFISAKYLYNDQSFIYSDNVAMGLRSKCFIIEHRDNLELLIRLEGIEFFPLSEDDIIINGFDADIADFLIRPSNYFENVMLCYVKFTNISNRVEKCEKVIEIRMDSILDLGLDSHKYILQPNIYIVSMWTYLLICLAVLIICNTILTLLNINLCRTKIRGRKALFCLGVLLSGMIFCIWFSDIALYNSNVNVIIFVIILLAIEFLYKLFLAKRIFDNVGLTFFVIMISTISLMCFSSVFSSYYLTFKDTYGTLAFNSIILPIYETDNLRT